MPTPPQRPATIRTVAERAGVSKSLVSLVLRDSAKVSPEKRRAVQLAITELGYRPNAIARQLTEQRTRLVGVLLNDLRNPWFVDCLDGLTSVLHGSGLRTLLADGRQDPQTVDDLVHQFLELRVEGLALVGSMPGSTAVADAAVVVPIVVAANRDIGLPGVDVVANDDLNGATLATEHLVSFGHRDIAHLAGSSGEVAALRRTGYEQAMRSRGLAGHARVEPCDMTEDGGFRAAVRLLRGDDRPTAVFAVNDLAAIGLMSAAHELGLDIPTDLSVVGYDNTSLAQIRHVWLTSVDTAGAEVGRRAARALLQRSTALETPATLQLVPPTLRFRGTVGPPARH